MRKLKTSNIYTVFHILFWSVLIAIPTILSHDVTFFGLTHNFLLLTSLYHIGLFYLNAYFLYPRLLNRKTWWLYFLSIAALIALPYKVKIFLLHLEPGFQVNSMSERILFFGPIPFLVTSFIFRFVSNRIRDEKMQKEAKAEHLSAELKFLRSQINPHFIFNVMTNMVSLARQKSDLLEPSLIKLSELLRYMLYETGDDKFTVEVEIGYLRNYIDLQQMRFGEDVNIHFELQVDDLNCYIEPMLLIPFVENAFKHGIGLVKDPFIEIMLQVKERRLFFKIKNNYDNQNISKDKNSGIGLENIKKRLKLLYSNKYKLDIQDTNDIYNVDLKLDLVC